MVLEYSTLSAVEQLFVLLRRCQPSLGCDAHRIISRPPPIPWREKVELHERIFTLNAFLLTLETNEETGPKKWPLNRKSPGRTVQFLPAPEGTSAHAREQQQQQQK